MEWIAFLLVVHLMSTLLMAVPFYMLVIINKRAYFGAALGYFTERYMENIIRNNAVKCFIFQGTMLAGGLGLVYVNGRSWSSLFTFCSPVDNEYLIQPQVPYKFSDSLSSNLGGNIFGGEKGTTFPGQFDKYDNMYQSARFDFSKEVQNG